MLLEGVRSGRGMEIGSKEWKKFWEDYMHVFKRNKDTYMTQSLQVAEIEALFILYIQRLVPYAESLSQTP